MRRKQRDRYVIVLCTKPPLCLDRFESLDQEMNSLMGRILDVNQIVQQLLDGGHPSSAEVRGCQDHLNSRYQTENRIQLSRKTSELK